MFDTHEVNLRTIKDFTIKRLDPYGFWQIFDDKDKPVKWDQNQYTHSDLAVRSIEVYLAKQVETKKKVR